MGKLVMALGVFFFGVAFWIGVFPDSFFSSAEWDTRAGQFMASGIRVVMGLLLIMGARESRYPRGLKYFGWAVILAGLVILLVPLDAWAELIQWAMFENQHLFRWAGSVGGVSLGVFLVHAALPERASS